LSRCVVDAYVVVVHAANDIVMTDAMVVEVSANVVAVVSANVVRVVSANGVVVVVSGNVVAVAADLICDSNFFGRGDKILRVSLWTEGNSRMFPLYTDLKIEAKTRRTCSCDRVVKVENGLSVGPVKQF